MQDEEDSEKDEDEDKPSVFFEIAKPGGRRESTVKLETDSGHTGPKRQYRKTGGAGVQMKFDLNSVIDDEDEDDVAVPPVSNGGGGLKPAASPLPQAGKSALKSGFKQAKNSGVGGPSNGTTKGRGISFDAENETVDFDHEKTVAEVNGSESRCTSPLTVSQKWRLRKKNS